MAEWWTKRLCIMEMQKTYNPKDFEDRIYAEWEDSGMFRTEIDENKYYSLERICEDSFVSLGGFKLKKALVDFGFKLT